MARLSARLRLLNGNSDSDSDQEEKKNQSVGNKKESKSLLIKKKNTYKDSPLHKSLYNNLLKKLQKKTFKSQDLNQYIFGTQSRYNFTTIYSDGERTQQF